MTPSEFSLLTIGLVLGLLIGAAIVQLIRARPPAPREVRLTVSHDAIPRRASTLADDAFVSVGPEPARGGPADRRLIWTPMPEGASDRRTTVRFGTATTSGPTTATAGPTMAGAIPIVSDPGVSVPGRVTESAHPPPAAPPKRVSGPSGEMVGIPISSGDDPVFIALHGETMTPATRTTEIIATYGQAENSAVSTAPIETEIHAALEAMERPAAVALLDPPPAREQDMDPAAVERCAEERRVADERCELATRARARADAAVEALRVAQRAYDGHEAAAVTASWRADPRAVHDAKETAQGAFRTAVTAATTPDALESAARDWLSEINRINTDAREAAATATHEHAAATAIGSSLEFLGLEADATRIGAANADAACLSARMMVADCVERSSDRPSTFVIPAPSTGMEWMPRLDDDETLGLALEAGRAPRIFRLLRGDRKAMATLVASLAADDPDGRRRWQLLMTALVEAIVADAIEAGALEFPADHPFWGPFSRAQDRDIAHALSSLGYRFDGLGGWTDERHPTQRDLSLALGYAGVDPMRVRIWPTADETRDLFKKVTVAADEYLAGAAGALTLPEMVALLGRRADGLAEVWNTWGEIRPLLLEEV